MSDAGAAAEAPEHTLASPQDLLTMLACPEDWGFLPRVWVALSAPEELVSRRPEHTLAGRLQMKSNVLKRLASDAGLWGKAGLLPKAGVPKRLAEARIRSELEPLRFRVEKDTTYNAWWLRYTAPDDDDTSI